MAKNYDSYSHEELIRELHLRDRRIDLLKLELQPIVPTSQPVENSDDNQKSAKKKLTSINENLSSGNSELDVKTPKLTSCSMEDMSNLLASTGIATLFVDQQLHILCFTPAIIPSIKLTPSDIGHPFGSIVSRLGEYDCLEEDIQTVLDTRVSHELELQATSDVWYLLRITPYRILNDTIEGAAITFVDITERKRLEGQYYECDERLHSIVEQTIVGIAQVDVMGHYLFVNDQYCKFLGYAREELLRLSMQEMTDPDDLPYIMKLFQALVDDGADFHIERRYRRKDGSILWVRNCVNGIRDKAGKVQSVVAICIDITQSKLAEEKLQHNQARLKAIVDTASNGIITINQSGFISTFNTAAERMFDYAEAEVIGRNISELMPSPYREQHDDYLALYLKSGKSKLIGKSRDVLGQRKDGSTFPMSLGIGEFFDRHERIFTGIVQDISDRKTAEMSLRESEERFRSIFEQAGVGAAIIDSRTGRFLRTNRKYAEIVGLGINEMLATSFKEITYPDDLQSDLDNMERLKNGLISEFSMEKRYIHKNGSIVWVSLTVSPMWAEGHDLRQHIAIVSDITERKQLEVALRESEARFRQITESLPQLIWTCKPDGSCDYLSRQWIQFTGIPAADQLGFNWLRQIHPADKKGLLEQWNKAVEGGTPYNVEYRIRCHDVSYYWFNGRAIPLRNEAGQILKWFGSSTDISERKLAERQLREHQNHYERLLKLEVANQTVAAIAHELNQPLNAAASYTDAALRFLQSGNPKPGQLSEALEQSAQQIQRSGQVIHELCRFLLTQETITERIDLNEMVAKILRNFELDGQFGRFSATAELAKELPAVRANEIQIEKVLNNLIRNGLEAMQETELEKGCVHMTVRSSDREGFAQITICDNGPELSENTLRHLFHPFFTTKPKGLGIGLALSRAIIEAQGGELWVEQVTTPTTFHLILPFAKEPLP
jgi:PAS domain S-box-containing protein